MLAPRHLSDPRPINTLPFLGQSLRKKFMVKEEPPVVIAAARVPGMERQSIDPEISKAMHEASSSMVASEEIRTVFTPMEWREEAIRRFGKRRMEWRFVCPCCGHEASIKDWKEAGAKAGHVAFSCVGRYVTGFGAKRLRSIFTFGGPCNYAGGGPKRLIRCTSSLKARKVRSWPGCSTLQILSTKKLARPPFD